MDYAFERVNGGVFFAGELFQQVFHEAGLAAAGYAGDDVEPARGEPGVEPFQIVPGGAVNAEKLRLAALRGGRRRLEFFLSFKESERPAAGDITV